jgi:hypothetical protein
MPFAAIDENRLTMTSIRSRDSDLGNFNIAIVPTTMSTIVVYCDHLISLRMTDLTSYNRYKWFCMDFRVSSFFTRFTKDAPASVTLVGTQDLVQLRPLLTVVKLERLGELVELFQRLVLEVRGVFVTELFLSIAGQYSISEVRKAGAVHRRYLRKGGSPGQDAR